MNFKTENGVKVVIPAENIKIDNDTLLSDLDIKKRLSAIEEQLELIHEIERVVDEINN